MTVETALAYALALSVPIWLAIEEILRNSRIATFSGTDDIKEARQFAARRSFSTTLVSAVVFSVVVMGLSSVGSAQSPTGLNSRNRRAEPARHSAMRSRRSATAASP